MRTAVYVFVQVQKCGMNSVTVYKRYSDLWVCKSECVCTESMQGNAYSVFSQMCEQCHILYK